MGDIAAVAKAAEELPQRKTFKDELAANWGRIQSVLPKHMNSDRLFQMAMSAYNTTPKLAECSTASVLSCIMKCGALGIEPSAVDGLGRAYVLPYFNSKTKSYEATFILGYKGMIDLCRRSGELVEISSRAVYDGDLFEYEFGLDEKLRHVPSQMPKQGREMTYVYCVAKFRDGGHYVDVMSRQEVDAVKARSKSPDRGPWVTDYEAMAKKTVLRRAFPYLPVSIEVQRDAEGDESTPRFVDADGVLFGLPAADEQEPVYEV